MLVSFFSSIHLLLIYTPILLQIVGRGVASLHFFSGVSEVGVSFFLPMFLGPVICLAETLCTTVFPCEMANFQDRGMIHNPTPHP